ncbi:hypothetical protein DOTSEDRAFT_74723 [Dothistroma septosporum NZE10]|uniref:Uncharacterized protein n=1 Tax=Dothistroma septosporum (strain NZE10 / CBS 128990) TaxID=675120 RepID=N1PCF9_DOTSN|nr:hypothetical protein DOTSEDRAFT_74723 [Dothistroma septosporum NZE10]
MRIFESYIKLQDEKDLLQRRSDQETQTTNALISKFNMAEKDWQDEMQDYKEEVKRLEVLLAKASRRGLAEVTLARQDSKLLSRKAERQDGRETIFEFLEKTPRRHDSVYNNQRGRLCGVPTYLLWLTLSSYHEAHTSVSFRQGQADISHDRHEEKYDKHSL